jgi:hypothetical protein
MAAMANDDLPAATVDARPFLRADPNSPWTEAAARRDLFAAAIEKALGSRGIRALVLKSQPGIYPISLSATLWTSETDVGGAVEMERASVAISIEVDPYRAKPLIYHIGVQTRRRHYSSVETGVDEEDAAKLMLFALELGPRPEVLPTASTLFARWIEAQIPFLPAANPLIAEARPNRFTWPTLLVGMAVVIALLALGTEGGAPWLWMGAIGALAAAYIISTRRPVCYTVVKRPEVAPRSLMLVDSWHTVIPGIDDGFDTLVERIERSVQGHDPNIRSAWETHHYRTPYGFEDRRRLALIKDQAVVHIHLYPFARDAFVGWDGFLNHSCWAETVPVSVTVRDGRKMEFRTLTVAPYAPSEVDLVELNALSELVHRRMTMEIKALLKERQIEADIDYSIIRGVREGQLGEAEGRDRPGRGGWKALKAARS